VIREYDNPARVRLYAGLVRQLGRTRAFSWVASRALPTLDRRFRGHPPTATGTDFPLCYLTVPGRKSGTPRTVPLLHVRDGERVVVIASNFGRRRHPDWAFDLEAAGDAVVEVPGGEARTMAARRATHEEFARYWSDARRFWPGYDGYRRRAGREIRMFVLEPPAAGRP
jgi:deazaflavin-dependent oxidoreductase (nitroreductase family)